MLNLADVDEQLKSAGLPEGRVLRMAGLCPRYLYKMRLGLVATKPATLSRIRLAIARLRRGESNPDDALPAACYRLAVAYVAHARGRTPDFVLSSEPGKRATADPLWMEAAQLRRWAIYIANQYLNLPQAELARAAGMSKAAVSYAMNDVEDERGDPELERLLSAVEGAFSI